MRYKAYLRELHPLSEHTKSVALATNREVFADPENVRAIRRYSDQGLFPWEQSAESVVPARDQLTAARRVLPVLPALTVLGDVVQADHRARDAGPNISPEALGNPRFRQAHGIRYNYVAGAMYKGIASVELVTAMGSSGMLGFFGTGGLSLNVIDDSISRIKQELRDGQAYGMNLLSNPQEPELEMDTVELYLGHRVRCVEASAYIQPPPLVRFRLAGLSRGENGEVLEKTRIIAKVSRTEVAERFLRPAPAELVPELLQSGSVTAEQAELGARLPLAQDLCVEADSAGHTDAGNAYILMPAMCALRDQVMREECYPEVVRIGAAGGIGTPEAALAFMLGAEFIVTGSINQCTAESGTSEAVKDMLQELSVHDMGYAPAGDMFEVGARVQAVKKGLFFPARAQKLYELYLRHDAIEDLDDRTRTLLEGKYFKRSFETVWEETRAHLGTRFPERLAAIEQSPKQKMAFIFRWYFIHSARLAMTSSDDQRVDYQIHCGPAMGAFNAWVKGTPLEPWRQRSVNAIAEHLLRETAALLGQRLGAYDAREADSRAEPNNSVRDENGVIT